VPRLSQSKQQLTTRRPTVKDVARQAGVSAATVSCVLTGTSAVDDVLADRVRADSVIRAA